MELRTQYWDDPDSKAAFQQFMVEIFGLDFGRWDQAGCWDPRYTPFSFFEDGRVVASVCGYLLPAVVGDREGHLLQISGVGTTLHHRRRGLSRELTERALEWAEGKHLGVFLFSSDLAVPVYSRTGFRPVSECLAVLPVEPVSRRPGAVKLDLTDPAVFRRVRARAEARTPVSRKLWVGSPELFLFHLLYGLRAFLHEIPDLDCLVVYDRQGDRLRLYDLVGPRIPRFEELYPFLVEPTDRVVEFHFSPDLVLDGSAQEAALIYAPLEGNHPFVRGDFPRGGPSWPDLGVFPTTGRA